MPFATLCTNCGKEVQPTDRFCASCGTARTPETQPSDHARRRVDARRQALLNQVRNATSGLYEVRGELGSGGMAAVYLAHDLRLPRRVAIKVMLPGLGLTQGMIERFEEEAKTAARLDHPHIVIIYSVEEVEGLNFFVMKYIDGASLEEILRAQGRLSPDAVRLLLVEVASALHYAHGEHVIHRDVKPANVMVDHKGNAIVTDFGISKTADSPVVTVTGSLIGTPPYISPEQWRGLRATAASDQYALGVVAFQLLAGRLPFSGDAMELRDKHINDRPPLLTDLRDDCPPHLAAAISRMLEKRPEDRWHSLHDLAAAVVRGAPLDLDSIKRDLAGLATSAKSDTKRTLEVTPVSPPIESTDRAVPVRAERVVVSPDKRALHVGDRVAYSAVPQSIDGKPLSGRRVVWSSSHPSIAMVDEAGVVTGRAPGQTTIAAQVDGVTGTASVEVRAVPVARLKIERVAPTLMVGDSLELSATPVAADGAPLANRRVTWATSNAASASVSDTGRVHAHAVGTIRITARCEDCTESVDLGVVDRPVATVTVEAPRSPLAAGKRLRLRATARDSLGNVLHAPIAWRSAKSTVATVADDGTVTGVAPGETAVAAKSGGVSGSTMVRVVAAKPSLQVRALASAQSARGAALVRLSTISRATSRAASQAASRVAARAAAISLPRAIPRWAWWVPVGVAAVFLIVRWVPRNPDPPKPPGSDGTISRPVRMSVTPSDTSLSIGDALSLVATLHDSTGKPTIGPEPDWESSAPNVVRVDVRGRAFATGPGVATIRARAGSFIDSVRVTVNRLPVAVATVAITRRVPTRFLVGDSYRLAAVARDALGDSMPGIRVRWESNNRDVATVAAGGTVRGVAAGGAIITARVGDAIDSVTVRVFAPRIVRLALAVQSATLRVGTTSQVSATAVDERGSSAPPPVFAWTSDRSDIASVDNYGLVRANRPGSATITATGGGVSGSTQLFVVGREPPVPDPPPADPKPPVVGRPAEEQVRRAVAAYVQTIATRDVGRVTTLYGNVSGDDQRNRNALVSLMRDESRRLKTSNPSAISTQVESTNATAQFRVRLDWRTPFGANRQQMATFAATFRRNGDQWEMVSCRLLGRPELE